MSLHKAVASREYEFANRSFPKWIFRRMTTSERLTLALDMSESLRNVALAGLRSRRPELSAAELSRELTRLMYGFAPQS